MICNLCRKPWKKFEIKEIHADTSCVWKICSHCILDLKRQLSLFDLTFWVKDGKGHFNSHGDTAAFYTKGNVL